MNQPPIDGAFQGAITDKGLVLLTKSPKNVDQKPKTQILASPGKVNVTEQPR